MRHAFRSHPTLIDWLLATAAAALVAGAGLAGGMYWRAQQPEQCFQRALAALEARQLDAVQRELGNMDGAAEFEPHRRFLRGALLARAGKPYAALDELGHAVNHPELRLRTLTLSAQTLYDVGRYLDAVGLLLQAVEQDPEAVGAHRLLASAYYDLGLTDNAMVHLGRIAELEPADPRPHRLMGLMHKDFENYRAAVASYGESLRRGLGPPERQTALLELAECQLKLRQADAALETLAQCRPSADRWAAEAECHHAAGRPDEAKRLVEQALGESPAHLAALLLKGTFALEAGKAAAAAEVLRRAVIAFPKDYTARFKLAQALRRAGDEQAAAEQAKTAEEIRALRREFSDLHQKAAREPGNVAARCRLGTLARQLDRPDLARVWFRAALAIDPRHEEARRGLLGQ
jgi:tetratricopeptide (TPR) repeat protein